MEGAAYPVKVTIDRRERESGLIDHVASVWSLTCVAQLPVADVEIGSDVLIERKTIPDFLASLGDGRLFAQARATTRVSPRPLLILEGEDTIAAADIEPTALRGVLLALTVGFRIPILRTSCVSETAAYVAQIARRESRRRARRSREDAPRPRTARAALDVLAAIPGVGDHRARLLVSKLGSLRGVMLAEEADLASIDGIGQQTASRIQAVAGSTTRNGSTDGPSASAGSRPP